jgi:hypothetical protein
MENAVSHDTMKYYRAFDKMLTEHMEKGNSYATFYATIGVSKADVDSWLSEPSFAFAKEIGEGLRRKTLESLLLGKLITLDVFEHLVAESEEPEMGDDIILQARKRFG